MPETINQIETKVVMLADEVKQHFATAGENAKQQMLLNFKSALEKDVGNLKTMVDQSITEHGQSIKDSPNQVLNKSIGEHLGGNIFGSLLQNLVLPTVFNAISGQKIDINSPKFREAAGQALVDIGNAIAKSNSRNS